MKFSTLRLITAFTLSFLILCTPLIIVHAQSAVPGGSGAIKNPLTGTDTLEQFMTKLLRIIFLLGTTVVVFFIVISGFKFVMAQGNDKELETAKRMLLYSVIGAVILLGAQTIATVVKDIVTKLGA